jgi:parallel beta-helix repeat protein
MYLYRKYKKHCNKELKMKKIMSTLLAFVIALTITAVAPLVQPVVAQTTIYVDADATGANDGTSWADAYTDLQSALSTTTSGDEIRVAQGTYYPGTNRTDSFAMKNGVAIYGGYAGYGESDPDNRNIFAYPTILSGDIGAAGYAADNCYHVFFHIILTNLDSTAVLDGFTITGGNADGSGDRLYGGGMFNEESSPTVTNCIFSDNTANYGGGMYNDGSSPTVTNCTFNNNSAYYGSGMYNYSSSSPTVTNCTFSGNTAVYGGGGMYNSDSSSPAVTGCTFSGNSATDSGGGMHNYYESSPTVTNCTFSGNTAGEYGGGMYSDFYCEPTVTNCVLWCDLPGEIQYDWYSTPVVTYCDIQGGYSGAGNIDANPLLDPGSLHLQAYSPCIDAGNNAAVPSGVTTDFEGDPRFLDDTGTTDTGSGTPPIVDMGADEFTGQSSGPGTQYKITATAGTGGTISPSGDVLVNEGDDQTFTITPDAGYSIANVLVDGSSVGAVANYTFNTVEADHTIDALFVNFPPVLEQILSRLDDIEAEIDNLGAICTKLDIEIFQMPNKASCAYQVGASIGGLPVNIELEQAYAVRPVPPMLFEDVFEFSHCYSFGEGHLRVLMDMPKDFDVVLFQFIFVNPDTGLHGTVIIPNEYGDFWEKAKQG